MNEAKQKSDFIKVDELYFGKVGQGVKNRFLKWTIDLIFSDKIKKKKFSYSFFSITFLDTEVEWYSNFMNEFFSKATKVKCFFTKDNDSFVVYPVWGNQSATSVYTMPKETRSYVDQRKDEWQGKDKKWILDESTVKGIQEGKQYSLEYRGEYESEGKDYNVFERTVFSGRDKVVFQAFVLKGGDKKTMTDIEKISHSIEINRKKGS